MRNLGRQGFKTFLPFREETSLRRGKFHTTLKPLFPGYVFVAINAHSGGWRAVNSTWGIKRLVSFGLEPALVPNDIMVQLGSHCDSDGRFEAEPNLKPNDVVCMTSGPFSDFVARVESITPDRRVWVLLELMGRKARVVTTTSQLRNIKAFRF